MTAVAERPSAESPQLPRQVLCGWGRTAPSTASVARPSDGPSTSDLLRGWSGPVIARGLGRSYDDAAQCSGGLVIETAGLCHIGAIALRLGRPLQWDSSAEQFVGPGVDKANDMVANNYFAHTSPSGLTPWYWFEQVGYGFTYAGENLAVNFSDSQDVTNAWMNSAEHRANILNANFTQIGIATATGTYNGAPATYVVEDFGTPVPPPPPAEPIAFVNSAAAEGNATAPAKVVPAPVAKNNKPATKRPTRQPGDGPWPTQPR